MSTPLRWAFWSKVRSTVPGRLWDLIGGLLVFTQVQEPLHQSASAWFTRVRTFDPYLL